MVEAKAWLYERELIPSVRDSVTTTTRWEEGSFEVTGWTETPLYPAEALAERDALIAELRRDEVQAIGAAISTRNWQALERQYNSLRDKIDRHAVEVHLRRSPQGEDR